MFALPVSPALRLKARGENADLYLFSADDYAQDIPELAGMLSGGERQRAESYRNREKGEIFIIGRSLLRSVLARQLKTDPGRIRFDYNDSGKPSLQGISDRDKIHFNVSHSNRMILIGTTAGNRIGVDIEGLRENRTMELILEKYASPGELRQFGETSGPERLSFFYRWWTVREAWIKAIGTGVESLKDRDLPGDIFVKTYENKSCIYSICII